MIKILENFQPKFFLVIKFLINAPQSGVIFPWKNVQHGPHRPPPVKIRVKNHLKVLEFTKLSNLIKQYQRKKNNVGPKKHTLIVYVILEMLYWKGLNTSGARSNLGLIYFDYWVTCVYCFSLTLANCHYNISNNI